MDDVGNGGGHAAVCLERTGNEQGANSGEAAVWWGQKEQTGGDAQRRRDCTRQRNAGGVHASAGQVGRKSDLE